MEEIIVYNQRSLKTLSRAVTLSDGQFALILVRCNYEVLQYQMRANLHELCPQGLDELILPHSIKTLFSTILKAITLESNKTGENQKNGISSHTVNAPKALMILGLESVKALDQVLIATNQVRDEFRKNFPFPLVLWVTDEVLTSLTRFAPDFKSWAATSIKFEIPTAELLNLLHQISGEFLTNIVDAGISKFIPNNAFNLSSSCRRRQELESAHKDLASRHIILAPFLAAIWEFILGRDAYAIDEIDTALDHYQQSLEFSDQELIIENNQQSFPVSSNNNLLPSQSNNLSFTFSVASIPITGLRLFHIGLCYCRLAELQPRGCRHYWQKAKSYFQQSADNFEKQGYAELRIQLTTHLGEVLRHLEAWTDLQILAEQLLMQLGLTNNPVQLAQCYGFLAEVAQSQGNWQKACKLAKRALKFLTSVDFSLSQKGLYLLILATSQWQLGERATAIYNLELEQQKTDTIYTPKLYIDILSTLRAFYFQEGCYLEAFKIKQKQRSIEQQYGFCTFLGANPLQTQKQIGNTHLFERISSDSETTIKKLGISSEIIAAGRQKDITYLMERISRNDHKLMVIHGASGVGKSSLLNAGLIPSLKNYTLAARETLPIIQKVYTDWLGELGKSFSTGLQEWAIRREESEIYNITQVLPTIINLQSLLQQLHENADLNLLTVLIFDQFEEFFFICTDLEERREFYHFLRACLNIPFVKVILSIREDYIHYLLECDRLINIDAINNNILDKNIRYYLHDISSQDATKVIECLTARSQFYLEPELISKFVADLAEERGLVRLIELQVVGFQLQAEKIKTLAQYQELGTSPIAELVRRSLHDIIKDCGLENESYVWKILFSLTNDRGNRPLKSKSDLLELLGENYSAKLDLILEILLGSGLVLRILQESENRYQLVHDYLVQPLRQSYKQYTELHYQIQLANKEQKISLIQQQKLRAVSIGISMAVLAIMAGGFGWRAEISKKQAELAYTAAHLSELSASSEALFSSHKAFDALIEGLRAGKLLKHSIGIAADTKMQVVTALEQAVYNTKERNRFEGHNDVVWNVSFSPDGKMIASGSRDKTVRIWRLDGSLISVLQGHEDSITSASFSPDGKMIATASHDKTIKLWRIDGTLVKTFKGHNGKVFNVNFSPDGKLLASASGDDTIKIWTVEGTLVKTLKANQGAVMWVNFSPNGQMIVSAGANNTIKLWQPHGRLLKTLLGHSAKVNYVSFSHDGQIIGSTSDDQTIKLWDIQGQLIKTFVGHDDIVLGLSFSPDDRIIASASSDNTIRLWQRYNYANKNNILPDKVLYGHSDGVTSIQFSPDGKTLASSSYDKTVRLWGRNYPLRRILRVNSDFTDVNFSPDGNTLVTASKDNILRLWTLKGNKAVLPVLKTTFLNPEFHNFPVLLKGHRQRIDRVIFSPDGLLIASASRDKTIKLWHRYGKLIKTFIGHQDAVLDVAFSPDGQLIASASRDKTIKLWNLHGEVVKTLTAHGDRINAVTFSPDGKLLASASDDKTVKIWTADGNLIKTLTDHTNWVLDVAFSPDSQWLASASYDNTVKLWNRASLTSKESIHPARTLKGHTDSVAHVHFSPDGKILATTSWDKRVQLWRLDDTLIKSLEGHTERVTNANFSPDGRILASASYDHTVILWNLDLDSLLQHSCLLIKDYLRTNPKVRDGDHQLCN